MSDSSMQTYSAPIGTFEPHWQLPIFRSETAAARVAEETKKAEAELEIRRKMRWRQFINNVSAHAPKAAEFADRILVPVRQAMGGEWPLAAATEDYAVMVTWEDDPQVYVEFEIETGGGASWFCSAKNEKATFLNECDDGEPDLKPLFDWLAKHRA